MEALSLLNLYISFRFCKSHFQFAKSLSNCYLNIMKDIALIVLDVQDTFLDVIPKGKELLRRCGFAVEAASLLGLELIYTEQYPDKLGGTNATLLAAGLGNARCFSKKTFSAFGALGFTDFLKEKDLEHILIAGLETSICVYQTIMDAMRNDLEVTMLSDCVAGRRDEDSYAIVGSLQNSGCHRLPSETIFYSMLQSAEDPRFKQFNDIVKKYS